MGLALVALLAISAPLRILALGDSYTIGQGVPVGDRWPDQLKAALIREGSKIDELEIIARTGWTTRDLLQAIESRKPVGPYSIVTVLVGVNDQFQGLSPETYRRDLRRLLVTARALGRVIVLSIPDWGATPFAHGQNRAAIGREIDTFNRVAQEEAKNAGAPWINVTDISRRALDDDSLVARDGLHPSAKMYAAWVERITSTDAARRLLRPLP